MDLAPPRQVHAPHTPYCGTPPVPAELLGRWNLDPVLLVTLAALALAYGGGLARLAAAGERGCMRPGAFYGGWAVLVLAFVSPLCSLGVALFAARLGQHLLLALVAVPLLVLGHPLRVLAALCGRAPAGARPWSERRAGYAAAAFAAAVWIWHAPGPYAATFHSDAAYWAMHLSILASAGALWSLLLGGCGRQPFGPLWLGGATSLHLGALGALLCFAPAALYAPHHETTAAWGLSPLADQQLGGVLCWVPGCAVFLIAGLAPLAAWLRERDTRSAAAPPAAAQSG